MDRERNSTVNTVFMCPGDPILQGRMKLSLTATSLQYLHSCFETLQSGMLINKVVELYRFTNYFVLIYVPGRGIPYTCR